MNYLKNVGYLYKQDKNFIVNNNYKIIDDKNYRIAIVDLSGNIVYMNRNFLNAIYSMINVDKDYLNRNYLNIRDVNFEMWLAIKDSNLNNLNIENAKKIRLHFGSNNPVGYLFLQRDKRERNNNIQDKIEFFNKGSVKEIFLEDLYDGLYLADSEANTLKVNASYEKISLLPEFELKGKNLRELEEKGYFSKSVTLLLLDKFKAGGFLAPISIEQKIITGKEALVTGIPIVDDKNSLEYIVTIVKEIIPIYEIAKKLTYTNKRRIWRGFKIENDVIRFDNVCIIAKDRKTKDVIEKVQNVSCGSFSVLLTGETGVGKDLMAKYLYHLKCKQKGTKIPFVVVNCSAIPKDLLETEMFGYEPGAFSGASKNGKKGLIELANGGILFLNEIGEMPLDLQSKFLTVLDNGKIRRVGGLKEYKISFQLVSATNKDLDEAVRENKFRKDLYYRISDIVINIPPLRERRDDILPLLLFAIEEIRKKYNDEGKILSSSVIEILINYSWPGNIRELFAFVKKMWVLSSNRVITVNDIPYRILKDRKKVKDVIIPEDNNKTLREMVRDYEIQIIKEAINKFGSFSLAAKSLGIDVSTLRRKLKRK